MRYNLPVLTTDNQSVNKAFRIAYSDIMANIVRTKSGLLECEAEVIYAGMGYKSPWTRDAAINVSNCCAMLFPEAAKSTLLSVIDSETMRIGGEYWDFVIWILGAWNYYLCTHDDDFLRLAVQFGKNSLDFLEETEFNDELNLFRGPACYGDGVAAYPDIYAKTGESGIAKFAVEYPQLCANIGVGIPMFTLSTNCLYYRAYEIMSLMTDNAEYKDKAARMKAAVNKHFWMEDKGYYRYIKDGFGNCDRQEGMGQSFAVLFGIADEHQTRLIMKNQHITPNGIACVWPSFERYTKDENEFGRHSGTVWPHIQSFWADAAARCGHEEICGFEFDNMTDKAIRDGHFAEMYHPINGSIYGGLQELNKKGIVSWASQVKQTWSATGYMRIILFDIFGIRLDDGNITFRPKKISGITVAKIENIIIGNKLINLKMSDGKTEITKEVEIQK